MVSWKEIEKSLAEFGWELDGGFQEHLLIGGDHNLSILAYPWAPEADGPVFELFDGERWLAYRVKEVLTPQQAAELLEEHGASPPEE